MKCLLMANAKRTSVNSDSSESVLPLFHCCPVTYLGEVLAADVPCGLLFLSDNWDLLCTYIMCLLPPESALFQIQRAGNYLFSPPCYAMVWTISKEKRRRAFWSEWFSAGSSDGLCRALWKATLTFPFKTENVCAMTGHFKLHAGSCGRGAPLLSCSTALFQPQGTKAQNTRVLPLKEKNVRKNILSLRGSAMPLCLHPELGLH